MALAISSVIRRHMKTVDRFALHNTSPKPPFDVDLGDGEEIVGWYVNPPPREDCIVLFTTVALHIATGGSVERISLDQIVDYITPESKTAISGVTLKTTCGYKLVPILGSHGPSDKFRDAFNFIAIIRALIQSRRAV